MIVINGNCLEVLNKMPMGRFDLSGDGRKGIIKAIFADIPDNIGLGYRTYRDDMPRDLYYLWVKVLLLEALPRCQVLWLSYNAIHDLEISWIVRDILKYRHPTFTDNKFLWVYGFNQYNDHDCAYGYRPILRLMRNGAKMWVDEIREVSERMKMGDGRAAGLRVPNNVWQIPRVVGNSWERVPEIPTQHPVRLMERIINFSIDPSQVGTVEIFVDLFGGSGSSLRGEISESRKDRLVVVEMDQEYCRLMADKFAPRKVRIVKFDDAFDFTKIFASVD